MAFWSTEHLKVRAVKDEIFKPYSESQIKHGAYQLKFGNEYYLTSESPQKKKILGYKEQLVVPPGQFALLLTSEIVQIPSDCIAFISIRAKYKLRGLINVSGFHVDPGFCGRLKFGVYNAGANNVIVDAQSQLFSIWFCNLTGNTSDVYDGDWNNQKELTAEDVMKLQGEVLSSANLKKEIDSLRTNYKYVS